MAKTTWVGRRRGGHPRPHPGSTTWEGPGGPAAIANQNGDFTSRGGGRTAVQPTITGRDSWVGAGGGRSANQPALQSNQLPDGGRSTQSTEALRNNKFGEKTSVSDPEGSYIFALEIDGIEVAQFLECSGIKTSTQVFELEEGGMNHRVHKLPGQSRWENVVLRYGVTGDISLLQWRDEILQDQFGETSRRNGSIVMKNNQMEVIRRYNFQGAWPVAYEGPSFSATSSEVAVEMIELAHHGIYVS